ncbi:MAG: hypothetical protein HY738_02875 [Bacteroidia bacterium]|nr:hypothetical protein [Bacteroidia bacterium]
MNFKHTYQPKFKITALFAALLLLANSSFALTFTSIQNGNWNDGATWGNASPGVQGTDWPANTDDAVIAAGHTVTLPLGIAFTINALTINATATLNANNLVFTINGNLIINGTLNNTSGTNIDTRMYGASLDGTGQITGTNMRFIFYANCAILATANITVTNINRFRIRFGANVVTNNGTITTTPNLTIVRDGVGANPTWTQGANSYLEINNVINTAQVTFNASAAGNTVVYNATGNRNITTPSASTYHHLTISGSSTKTMLASLIINGNLTINGGTLNPGANDINITIRGNWTNSGSFNPTTARWQQRVTFDGGSDQSITNSSGELFYRLTVSKGGGTLLLNNNVNINDEGNTNGFDLTMSGGNINTQGNTITLGSSLASGAGTLTRTAGQIIGKSGRWVNATATDFTFPVGTATNYRPAVFNAAAGLTNGFLIIEHISSTPGALSPNPFTDVVDLYYNTYNDGYWQLSVPGADAAVCTDFNVNLDGNGFTAFPIENGPIHFTRVLKRVSGVWQAGASTCINDVPGCPNGVTGNVVSRNLISGITGDYAFISRYNCTPPSAPTISGTASVCTNQLDVAYSCTGTASSTFTWTIPTGNGTIDAPSSGVGVQNITVDWGATGGSATVRVVENNGCSNSDPGDFAVTIHPVPTSSITGSNNVTEYTDGEPYSVTNTAGYTYTWTITGGSVASGQGTNAITVNWGASGAGNVNVVATPTGGCPNDAPVNLPVTIVSAYTSNGTGGGNWGDAASWTCLCVPSATSSIRILNGDVITRTLATQNIRNVTIDVGGILDIGDLIMTISGNLVADGELRMSGATARTLTLSGVGSTLGGTGSITATAACGTKSISISEAKTIPSSANLLITNVRISTIGANVTVTNNGTVSINCNITGSSATTSKWVNAAGSRLNIGSSLLSTGVLEASASGNTVNYNPTAAQNVKVPVTTYYNLEVTSGAATVSLIGATTVTNSLNIITGRLWIQGNSITVNDTTTVSGTLEDNDNAGTNTFTYMVVNPGGTLTTQGGIADLYTITANLIMYGGTITSTAGTIPTYNIGGTFTVPSGTATIGAGEVVFTISGATTISGTLNISSELGTKTFNDFTINTGGTFNSSVASAFVITGSLQNDGTFTSDAATYNLSGAGPPVATKTISGTSGFTFGTGIVTVSGTYNNNTTLTVPNLTVTGSLTNNSTCNVTTTFDGAGTYTNAAGSTLNVSVPDPPAIAVTTFDPSANCNLVNYNGSAAQTIRGATYCNLQVATTGGATATFSNTVLTIVNNNFTVVSGGIAAHIGVVNLTVSGSTSITGTLNFTTATTGTKSFNNVTVNAGGVWSNTINSPVTITGNIQHDGTTFTSGTGLYTLSGATKTISGSSSLSISDVTISGSYTNNYTVASGCTLSTAGYSLAGAGSLTQATNGILYIGGNASITTLTATVNPNTVYYVLAQAAQDVKATIYHHLEISKSAGTANLTGATQVNGNITISAGTLSANGANNITLYGNWINSDIFTGSTGTVVFTGTAAQTITGATTFNNFTLDKGAVSQTVTLNNNTTIGGILTFTLGKIVTGGNYAIISAGGSVSGASATTGWVQGYLQKNVALGSPVTPDFEVGGNSVYAPVNMTFASVTAAGNFIVKTTDGDHPEIASSNIIPTESLNRYWTLINSSVTFTTFNATYNFVPGDLDAGVDPTVADFNGKRFDSFSWSSINVTTRNATNTVVTGEPLAAYTTGQYRETALGISIITSDIYTRRTSADCGGNCLWNDKATWIQYRTGSITYSSSSTTVTGTGTKFTSELAVNDVLMCQTTPGTIIGTVFSITDNSILTLYANATGDGSCDYGRQAVPSTNDQIVYIGNPNVLGGGVDVTFNPASAIINQLVFYRYTTLDLISNSLTHNAGTTLTIQISATVNQPNADGQTHSWNINNGGKVKINSSLTIGSNDATATRVARVVSNYGDSLNIGTGLKFRCDAGSNAMAVLDMSGGNGVVSVAGAVTLDNGTGTINGGAAGSITGNGTKTFEVVSGATFRMNGTTVFPTGFGTYTFGSTSTTQYYQTDAQNISAQTYGHLYVEPTTNGIIHTFLAVTTTVQGNLQIGNGTNTAVVVNGSGVGTTVDVNGDISIRANTTFSNSLIPSIFAGGNWTQNGTFTAATGDLVTFDGATNSQVISASTVTFPNVTVSKGSGNTLSTSGGLTTVTTNNLTVSGGTFTAPATLNINSTATSALTLNNGGTFTAGTTININGNWNKNIGSIFNEGTGTVNFTSATTPQTIQGTAAADTFYNVTVSKSAAGNTVNTGGGIVTVTTNNLTITTGTLTAPLTLNINGNMTLASGQTLTAGTTINSKGNWTNNGGTFTPGANTVVFNGSAAQQINGTAATQTFYNFTVTKTGSTTLDVGGSTTTFNATNVTLNSNTFAAGTAATINVSSDWTNNGGTFTPGTGTVFFTGTGAQQITGTAASETFYNVTLSKTAATLLNTGGSIATVTVNNLTQTTGNFTAPATLDINGNYSLAASQTFTAGANIYVGGNWTWTNTGIFTPGTGTVTFDGSGAQQINGTQVTQTFYNFTVAKTAGTALTVGGSTTTLNSQTYTNTSGNYTAPATFIVTANVLLTAGTFTAGAATNVGGNWTNDGGTFTPGTNTVTFNGTVSQLIGGTAASQTFYNVSKSDVSVMQTTGASLATLTFNAYTQSNGDFNASTLTTFNINNTINHTAGTFTAPGGTIVKGTGNWTNSGTFVHNSGTVQFNSSLTLGGTSTYSFNNVTISGGVLTAPAANMNVAGNWTNNSSFTHNSGTVTLNGNNVQQTIGGTISTTFNNLTVNNSYPGYAVTFSAPETVSGILTLTDGHITTTATNILTLDASASVTLGGAPQDSSFIKGPMNHTVNIATSVTKIYPVGKGNSYRRMELTIDQNVVTSTTYTAELFNQNATTGGCSTLPGTIDKVSQTRYYNISQSPATGLDAASIRMYFGCSGKNDGVTDLANLAVAKTNCPDVWTDLSGITGGTAACGGSYFEGYIDASFTSFSRFALANKTGGTNPLPVELLSFTAELDHGHVQLEWTTASEKNNDYFIVQKTLDGASFEEVARIPGGDNSNNVLHYSATDNEPYFGVSYYQLVQVDFNGKTYYSNLVAIDNSNPDYSLVIYPNPANSQFIYINIKGIRNPGKADVTFYDLYGRSVLSDSFALFSPETTEFIEIDLRAGIYYTKVTIGEHEFLTVKLVVKDF